MIWLNFVYALVAISSTPILADMYIPIGLGHRMHLCGTVVDENLKPVMDSMSMTITVTRPLVSIEGRTIEHKYHKTILNSKFCIDASYALRLDAQLSGAYIRAKYIGIEYRGISKDDFKWVVDRNPNIAKGPSSYTIESLQYTISIDTAERSWGYSGVFQHVYFSDHKKIEDMFEPNSMKLLFEMIGEKPDSTSNNYLYSLWNIRFPGMFRKEIRQQYDEVWINTKPKQLVDYFMFQRHDSIYFVPGPLVKTKFATGSLDFPVCNFSRMPPPPPIGNVAWRDTLLVAVGDSVVIDGFYVHFPWANIWGKANITRKVERTGTKIRVTVSHILAKVGDTTPFVYFNSVYFNSDADYRKCLTKVEAMWEGEYNTQFIGER